MKPEASPTLAEKLGTTAHLSPLLMKARRLGLDADGLERTAMQRGCDYYHDGSPPPPAPVSRADYSDGELAMALLNPALRYHPQTLRLGAAMLGAPGNDPVELARRAREERCEQVVSHIARAGRRFEPENPFWERLLALMPTTPPAKSGVLPHPTRFVAMTGITRRGVETVTQWIRPSSNSPTHG
ncbi:MAG: hypothetical protein J0L84_16080 [Verrucomicrobia bacterium]|nr:hypothetical protein [Verrucomicrobiota bacterium]